jgi:hypothetical protein
MGAPPNSLHYMGYGLNPYTDGVQTLGKVLPVIFPKMKTFEPDNKMDSEEDEGHTGQDTVLLGEDRKEASSSPSVEDKLRLGEGIEDILFQLLGAKDAVTPAVTGATASYKHKFFRDASDPPVNLPVATIIEGFNWGDAKPEAYINQMVDSVELTLNANQSPSYKAKFMGDFPKYNQAEPTLVFPETETRFKAYQTAIYIGPVGTADATLKTDTYKVDCYTEASLNMKNNLELSTCGGTTFGSPEKNRKPFSGEITIKMDYNESNMNLEAEWATGSSNGTDPTTESLFKKVIIKITGKVIETVVSPAATVHADMEIVIPKLLVDQITSPRSGKDYKNITLKGKIVSNANSLINPVEVTMITPLDELNYGTVP